MEFPGIFHLKNMKPILPILILLFSATAMAQEVALSRDVCLWPPPGYTLIQVQGVLVSKSGGPGNTVPATTEQEPVQRVDLSGLKNNVIYTKKDFLPLKDKVKVDINWKNQKLVFSTDAVVYKLGAAYSDYILTGISVSADGTTLCLGYRSTFYGVCQGIAQLSQWFSCENRIYAIVIPLSLIHI